jgi:hypothetical protein
VQLLALDDQNVVALAECGQPTGRQRHLAGGLRDLDRDVQFDEQLSEPSGPGLPGELGHPGEFPEVVGVAHTMQGLVVLAVGAEPVVDCDARERRQDPGRVHRDPTASAIEVEQRPGVVAGDVDPVRPARDPAAGLVEVRHPAPRRAAPGRSRGTHRGEPPRSVAARTASPWTLRRRTPPPGIPRRVPPAGAGGPADTPPALRRLGRNRSGRSPRQGTLRGWPHRMSIRDAALGARSRAVRSPAGQRPDVSRRRPPAHQRDRLRTRGSR